MFSDLLKIIKSFKKYQTESILIFLSIIITIISLFIFLAGPKEQDNNISVEADSSIKTASRETKTKIVIDVSGAINRPGVYELNNGSRINDAIEKAGGLSYEADTKYFYRNYNLSSYVYDQEKIYIPYYWEISSGIFVENPRILNYLSAVPTVQNIEPIETTGKVNINEATVDELDELPGIGVVTAQKIIQNRPYATIDDLLSKKIVNSGVFENIKSDIDIN